VTRLIQHHHQMESPSAIGRSSASTGCDPLSHPGGIAIASAHHQPSPPLQAHGLLPSVRDDSETSSHATDKSDGKFKK
jgi:hypothetical protein